MTTRKPFVFKAALIGAALLAGGTILATEGSINVTNSETCTSTVYYYDFDGDGYGSAATTTLACEVAPAGYSATSTDCNDYNALMNPGREELCDGLDNDCDGLIDEGLATSTFYFDADGDGFGASATTTIACAAPSGYSQYGSDCNDGNALIHPGADEHCNGIDDNCNGTVDEGATSTPTFYRDFDGDGYGNSASTTQACSAPTGYVGNSTDCNDNNASIHPGAAESCNGIDDNCNGSIDDNVVYRNYYQDLDNDGYGNASVYQNDCKKPGGYASDNTDCNDNNASIHPGAAESCNGIDDNCNGQVDESSAVIRYRDHDSDGYGNPNDSTSTCSSVSGYVSNNTDCNDNNSSIHPNATEYCNGVDDNCNGTVDENCTAENNTCNCDCDGRQFKNHGEFVSCMAHFTNLLKSQGEITGREKGQMMKEAAHDKSNCGAAHDNDIASSTVSTMINKFKEKVNAAKAKLEEKAEKFKNKAENSNKNKNNKK